MADSKNDPKPPPPSTSRGAGTVNITIDHPVPPPPTPSVPAGSLNADGTHDPALNGTLTLTLTKSGGTPVVVTKTPSGTSWSHTFTGLTAGTYVLVASIEHAGDTGTTSRTFTVTN